MRSLTVTSDHVFESILSLLRRGNDSGYPLVYPPIASWPKLDDDAEVLRSWKRALLTAAPLDLNVRVPFCQTVCTFCFLPVVSIGNRSKVDTYLAGLEQETKIYSPLFSKRKFDSLYIGGGTPNLLDLRELDRLFEGLHRHFSMAPRAQISMDANPEFLTAEQTRLMKAQGVNWLTIGVQSLEDKVTNAVVRTQTNSRVRAAYDHARLSGISGINIDLLCGLPEQTREGFLRDVETVTTWGADEVHIYQFKALMNTSLYKMGRKGTEESEKHWKNIQRQGLEILLRKGYHAIDEESAALGAKAVNRQTQRLFEQPFSMLGLGMGAVSLLHSQARYVTTMNFSRYRQCLSDGRLPLERGVFLGAEDEMIGYLLLQFAQNDRVSAAAFRRCFGRGLVDVFGGRLRVLVDEGVLRRTKSGYEASSDRAFLQVPKTLYSAEVVEQLRRRYHLD